MAEDKDIKAAKESYRKLRKGLRDRR